MYILTPVVALFLMLTACATKHHEMTFTVNAGDNELRNAPVYADIERGDISDGQVLFLDTDGQLIPAQVEALPSGKIRLWWVVSHLAKRDSANYGLVTGKSCNEDVFQWETLPGNATRLYYGNQPIIQYEHPIFDAGNIEDTKKPFHHVFDPEGTVKITKGPGGLYSHHRGIFFGFDHVYTNDKRIDIWHANHGERSEHAGILAEFSGPVMGGHTLQILWKDMQGEAFIEEKRTVRVFQQPSGESLIDVQSELHDLHGPVRLEGDLHHGGLQFRASQEVADDPSQTRFIRPAPWNHLAPDEEVRGNDVLNMPWNAMHFSLTNNTYTVAYLSHPGNAEKTEMSERLYGRFGEFFPAMVTPDNPLDVHYRFWIKTGEVPGKEEIAMRYHAVKRGDALVEQK